MSPLETAWARTAVGSAMSSPKVTLGLLPKVSTSPFFGTMPATTHMSGEPELVREVDRSPSSFQSGDKAHFEFRPNARVIDRRSPPFTIMSLELTSPSSLSVPASAGLLAKKIEPGRRKLVTWLLLSYFTPS